MSPQERERVAVILVPGIFASHLVDPQGGLAWPVNLDSRMLEHIIDSPPVQRAAFSHGDRFIPKGPLTDSKGQNLLPDGVGPNLGWQDTAISFYRPFLEDCHNAGPNKLSFDPLVYAIGYNFTRSNAVTAWRTIATQANRIQSENIRDGKRPRIIFVTHSMGALAVRSALRVTPELREQCICVIHVAAPNAGAPESFMRFVRGSLDKPPVSLIFGDEGWKCVTSATVIPAGFELMPFPMIRHRATFGEIVKPLPGASLPEFEDDPLLLRRIVETQFADNAQFQFAVKNGTGKVITIPPADPLRRWPIARGLKQEIIESLDRNVAAARAFHDRLGDYMFPRTGAVVLTGKPTVERVEVRLSEGKLSRVEETRGDGDGTVPVASQKHLIPEEFVGDTIRFSPIRAMSGVEHSDALGEKGRPFFGGIFDLMNLLYAAAPLRG